MLCPPEAGFACLRNGICLFPCALLGIPRHLFRYGQEHRLSWVSLQGSGVGSKTPVGIPVFKDT